MHDRAIKNVETHGAHGNFISSMKIEDHSGFSRFKNDLIVCGPKLQIIHHSNVCDEYVLNRILLYIWTIYYILFQLLYS